ncbi:MAG TPA: hypothetical protein PLO78_04460 [Candidatus Omnitrophota bacterium]|nr:hypothetical protein [Candidatus Omnitrophota bacterium]
MKKSLASLIVFFMGVFMTGSVFAFPWFSKKNIACYARGVLQMVSSEAACKELRGVVMPHMSKTKKL